MQIVNIGILAHVDAGKTTVTEQLLFQSGGIRALGSVDKGSAQTDWLGIERKRGISVKSSETVIDYNNVRINIIDTPGHMDFTGEVERSLFAMDAVVLVVSALEGIQSQTELFWNAIRETRLPAVIFVNKIDRTGCEPEKLLEKLRKEFSPAIITLNKVVDIAENTLAADLNNEDNLLALCENDDILAERYLDGEKISDSEIKQSLIDQTAQCSAFPAVFGSAMQGIGIKELLDAVSTYLPKAKPCESENPSGIVYKLEHDKTMGKIAHIRLFNGRLKNRDSVKLSRAGAESFEEKITQIRRIYGAKREDTGILTGGDIAAVYGLSGAKVGDIVGEVFENRKYKMAQPLFSVQAFAGEDKQNDLLAAVEELADEDPLLDCIWDKDERELVIKIMGKIQLEVIEYLLLERYGIAAEFSQPSVIYRETPVSTGIGFESYTMPKPCWAVVKLQIDPMPRGYGYNFESAIKDNVLFYRYQHHVETTVPETLRQGLYGWEVTDLKVTLIDGQHHTVHTHPMDFFLATPIAVMTGLVDCGTKLLEPFIKMQLTAPEEFSGKLIGDILGMRGEFDNPVIANGRVNMHALVPVAESMEYPARFASMTSGRGIIKTEFDSYRECPVELGATAKRRGVNPLDRAKWILHKRNAYGNL